jgi:hypothetical protein
MTTLSAARVRYERTFDACCQRFADEEIVRRKARIDAALTAAANITLDAHKFKLAQLRQNLVSEYYTRINAEEFDHDSLSPQDKESIRRANTRIENTLQLEYQGRGFTVAINRENERILVSWKE